MSRRAEKREWKAYHDSRRYLKKHPPRLSDPLFGLGSRKDWMGPVRQVIELYPEMARRREAELRAGGVGCARRGRSAEDVVMRQSGGPVGAVETALRHFRRRERDRLHAVLWGGAERGKADRVIINLFYRYVAVYLGYGRKKYDLKSV